MARKSWVYINFDSPRDGSLVRVPRTRASNPVTCGEPVTVFDPEAGLMAPAEIRIVDLTDNTISLDVWWNMAAEDKLGFFTASGLLDVGKLCASLPDDTHDPGDDPWGGANLDTGTGYTDM